MSLILAAIGIFFLIKGEVNIGSGKRTTNNQGRIMGVLLIVPIILFIFFSPGLYMGMAIYASVILAILRVKKMPQKNIDSLNGILSKKVWTVVWIVLFLLLVYVMWGLSRLLAGTGGDLSGVQAPSWEQDLLDIELAEYEASRENIDVIDESAETDSSIIEIQEADEIDLPI